MAVYTELSHDEIATWLHAYPVGALTSFTGISAGIVNTNYFVGTVDGEFVLTLFEETDPDNVVTVLALMEHLATRGVACASPVRSHHGVVVGELKNRPATLVSRLDGNSVSTASVTQAGALGRVLAELHHAGQDFLGTLPNVRGLPWLQATAARLKPLLTDEVSALLVDEVTRQQHVADDLPSGIIHADLFRDNVLFTGPAVTGIIDFYYACQGPLLFDLGVVVNDWCSDEHGGLIPELAQSLLDGYQQVRPITTMEKASWELLLRGAALRFWVSRLAARHFPHAGYATQTKDPDIFKQQLIKRITAGPALTALFD